MSRLEAVQKNRIKRPLRAVIFGIEGVGKTKLTDRPGTIVVGPEGGVDELEHSLEMPGVRKWTDVRESVVELINGKHDYKVLNLDSADWIEKLCHAHIVEECGKGKNIITCKGGYGAGYRESEKLHRELIEDLSILREKRNMHIVVTAHYHVRSVKDPDAVSDYDAFEIKCHEFVSSLWREWGDCVLFARFRTFLKQGKENGDKTIAVGDGERVVYTEKRPAFQAKNRFGLDPEMPFGLDFWDKLLKLSGRTGKKESVTSLKKEIDELSIKVKDANTVKAVVESVKKAKTNVVELTTIRNRLRKITAA